METDSGDETLQPSVLVVDDAPVFQALLADILRRKGYRVQTAEYGGPALAIMRTSRAHLLVTLGLMMPEVDGLAVLEAVAAEPALAQRHAIVMVTAAVERATQGRVAELREQLGVPLVMKPLKPHELMNGLKAAEWQWMARHGNAAGAEDAEDADSN